jgi:hypothetical protein
MDSDYINNHNVVARYLSDQLSEEEARGFEDYMIANPAIVRDLEITARLKVGLHKLHESGELAALLTRKTWWRGTQNLALAASLIVFALGAVILFKKTAIEGPKLAASVAALVDRSGAPLPIGKVYAILRTRESGFDAEIDLPPTPTDIALHVLPETEAHPARYRVSVSRIADDDSLELIGSLIGLVPDDQGFVSLYFDSSRLKRGHYQLSISGDVGTDAINSVSTFKIKMTQFSGA